MGRDFFLILSSSSEDRADLFADRAVFAKVVISVLREKFSGSNFPKRKKISYTARSRISRTAIGSSRWGEEHAADNIIRLIDAMEICNRLAAGVQDRLNLFKEAMLDEVDLVTNGYLSHRQRKAVRSFSAA